MHIPYTAFFFIPSLSNASYLIIARFLFLNIISLSEVFKKMVVVVIVASRRVFQRSVKISLYNGEIFEIRWQN